MKNRSKRLIAGLVEFSMISTFISNGNIVAAIVEDNSQKEIVENSQQYDSTSLSGTEITNETRELESGTYILNNNVTSDYACTANGGAAFEVRGDVVIYLNGYQYKAPIYTLTEGSHLTIIGSGDPNRNEMTGLIKGVDYGTTNTEFTVQNAQFTALSSGNVSAKRISLQNGGKIFGGLDADNINVGANSKVSSDSKGVTVNNLLRVDGGDVDVADIKSSSMTVNSISKVIADNISVNALVVDQSELGCRNSISSSENITISGSHIQVQKDIASNTGNVSIKNSTVNASNIRGKNVTIVESSVDASGNIGQQYGGSVSITGNSLVIVNQILDDTNKESWQGIIIEKAKQQGALFGSFFVLNKNITIPENVTFTIPQGANLPLYGHTLTVNGILVVNGSISGGGTIDGTGSYRGSGSISSNITNKLGQKLILTFEPISGAKIGDTIMLEVSAKKANGEEIKEGEIDFKKNGKSIGKARVENGLATLPITLTADEWDGGESYTINAEYSFYGSTLTGKVSCTLKILDGKQDAPPAPVVSSVNKNAVYFKSVPGSAQSGAAAEFGILDEYNNIKWQNSSSFYNLKPNKGYVFYTRYPSTGDYEASKNSEPTIVYTMDLEEQKEPLKPTAKEVTSTKVVLNMVSNTYGTKTQYGIADGDWGEINWQDSTIFDNLESDHVYRFYVKYLGNDRYHPSGQSSPLYVTTSSMAPIVNDYGSGTTKVTPKNPKKGDTVTIYAEPYTDYELIKVEVKDKNGNLVSLKKESEQMYKFVQPETQVTIEVIYKEKPSVSDTFYDVSKSDWFYDAVCYAYQNGLIVGVADGFFAPSGLTSRGQLVTMLWRMAGEPNYGTNSGFDDVSSSAYYARAVAWASSENIVAGFPDGSFRPNEYIAREQMAAFFMKYAAATGAGTYQREDLSQYRDINPNSWSYDALSWAKAVGLLSGVSDTIMGPHSLATRAQIAAVLQRYCETVAK